MSESSTDIMRISLTTILLAFIFLPLNEGTLFGLDRHAAPTDSALATKDFELRTPLEVGLELEARSPGASWQQEGAEAAAVTIEVDGSYSQDLLLFAGDKTFVYRVSLGQLPAGKHKVTVKLNGAHSAPATHTAVVTALRPLLTPAGDDQLAIANSPILYQRANTIDRFSDIPLLMYYEIWHNAQEEVRVRYTVIFTNEDGGTPSAALMARWGRAADIEWVYEFRAMAGKIVEETYQAVQHETKSFKGSRIAGSHPLIAVASDNNNFSDSMRSDIRFALLPIRADLSSSTRESVMDSNPWSYRIMAQELFREGRIVTQPNDINTIADPRSYLYVDVYALQTGTSISIELRHATSGSSSDLGESRLQIDRTGYFRTALRLPQKNDISGRSTIAIQCHASDATVAERSCRNVEIKGVYILDQDYLPRRLAVEPASPRNLGPNESALYTLEQR